MQSKRLLSLLLAFSLVPLNFLVAFYVAPNAFADSGAIVGYPSSMASTGDSITRGFDSDPNYVLQDVITNSWSTGTNPAVNSFYSRILAANSAISGNNFNDAKTGAVMAYLDTEVQQAISQKVSFLTILMGANDACTSSESSMTPVATFQTEFSQAMQDFSLGLPDARIYVASIPNVYHLWELLNSNPSADAIWTNYHICQSMLANPTSTAPADVQRRQDVLQRITDFNTVLQSVCAQYIHCRFDNDVTFNTQFTTSQVSTIDYFHPSVAGQSALAAGNYPATFDFTDNVPPVSTANVSNGGNNFSVTLFATDNVGVSGIEYKFGTGNWTRYTNPFTATVSSPVLTYRAVDVNGNVEASHTLNFANVTTSYTYNLPFLANNYTPSNSTGSYSTYLAFQNIGGAAANVQVQYYNADGSSLTATNPCPTVAQYGECVATNPFANGKNGTGVITSDQPLAVTVAEATPYGGGAYAVSSGSSSLLVAPLAINNPGGFVTQLTIFNSGASVVTATVVSYGTVTGSTPVQTYTNTVSLSPHSSQVALSTNNLPANFYGWSQISSPAGSQLVAQVLEQNASSHFVAIANAQPAPSTALYAPAIFNNAYGSFATGTNIVNPSSTAVSVTISYYDLNGTAYNATPFNLPGYAVQAIFDGASNSSVPGLPANDLPANFAGAAKVTATGAGVVMLVNEGGGVTNGGNAESGVYNALPSGSNLVGLPVMANGGYGYTTGATIYNSSSSPVTVSVQYYSVDGTPVNTATSYNIPANASKPLYQGAANLTNNFYGTAVISAANGSPTNSLFVTTNALSNNFFYTYSEPNS